MTAPLASAPPSISLVALPLMRFLSARRDGWRGSLSDLRAELVPYSTPDALPAEDEAFVAALRRVRPALKTRGWAMSWPALGDPVRFVKRRYNLRAGR